MLTEKDYCDYETCVALKELGYDELCEGYYHLTDDEDYNLHYFEWCCGHEFQNSLNRWRVGAPMLYEAQKWLREEKGVVVLVHHLMTQEGDWEWEISYKYSSRDMYHSYEEALSEGIKEAVKILKEK